MAPGSLEAAREHELEEDTKLRVSRLIPIRVKEEVVQEAELVVAVAASNGHETQCIKRNWQKGLRRGR